MPAIFIRFAPVALNRKKTNSPPIPKRAGYYCISR